MKEAEDQHAAFGTGYKRIKTTSQGVPVLSTGVKRRGDEMNECMKLTEIRQKDGERRQQEIFFVRRLFLNSCSLGN